MQTRHIRKLVSSILGLSVLGCLWFFFAPVALGGSTTYVVTNGVSMEPRFHTGDLALVRSRSSYHVGEIVAYHNNMLDTVVLHRIVGREGARYLFKGDNNNFVDFEHPTRSQLIGALWLHVPGAGARLQSIRSPALEGLLVAVGILLFAGAAFTQRQRRRRRHRRTGDSGEHGADHLARRPAEAIVSVLALGFIALLPFAALALLAFTRPPTARLPFHVPYEQSGTFSYSATATPGPAYPDNRAVTGDPLFTHVLNAVDLRFGYVFSAAAKHSLAGEVSLSATLTSTSGWHSTLQLGPPTYFRGDHALVTTTLELDPLLALMRSVQDTTRVGGSYTLSLVPHVSASGSLDLLPLHTTFSPTLQFSLSEFEAQPTVAAGDSTATGSSTASQFTPSVSSSATGKRYQPIFLSFKLARVSVATARTIALSAIAVIVCALLATLTLVRPRQQDEAASILARYGRLIISVAHVWQLPGVAVIDVADMDALVRIAEHYDRTILHETGEREDAFWVTDESGQFRYTVSAPAHMAAEELLDVDLQQSPLEVLYVEPEHSQLDVLANDVYADELELGGLISAYETKSAPAAAEPVAQDTWAAPDLADAITQEHRAAYPLHASD
jgi:signal peptidase I